MTNEERVKLEHDWLIAQFQLFGGAVLAVLAAVLYATIAGQMPFVNGAFWAVELGLLEFSVWEFFRLRRRRLLQRLKERNDNKE